MATKIQARRDTAANRTSTNPVLASGEPGFESNTGKFKWGDGTTAWNSLPYAGGGVSYVRIAFDAGASGPFTNQAAALGPWGSGSAVQFQTGADLTGFTQARLIVTIGTAGAAGALASVQYSLDNGATWAYLDGTSGPNVPETTGTNFSSWVTIAAAARTNVV